MVARNAYNTRRKSLERLEKEFIGEQRIHILRSILSELQIKDGERPTQHWMIIGPRGIGKSHLLTLLYYKIKSTPQLEKLWTPVLFPEELRIVDDLPGFLDRTLSEVLSELKNEQHPISEELQAKMDKLKEIPKT